MPRAGVTFGRSQSEMSTLGEASTATLNKQRERIESEDELMPPPQNLPVPPMPATLKRKASNVRVGLFGHIQMTSLIQACAEGNYDAVTKELEGLDAAAVNFDRDNWAGSTALHWAAYTGLAAIVSVLLAAKADPTLQNARYSEIPLHLAARYNRSTAVIEMLALAAPDTLDMTNSKGNTPLHEAAYEGRVGNVAELLRRGANLEAVNDANARGGLTPLLAAAEYGHLATVKVLLEYGADTATAPMQARRMRSSLSAGGGAGSGNRKSISAQGRTPQRILASGRQAATHGRIDLTPTLVQADMTEFRLPGYGALSVAMSACPPPTDR